MLLKALKHQNKRGFTLVEIAVTLLILGIVTAAIMTVFGFTNQSFISTSVRYDTQVEARRLMEGLRNELGYATSVTLHYAKPTTLPDAASQKGYCYGSGSNLAVHRLANQRVNYYFNQVTQPINVSITFTPKAPDNSTNHKINVIQVTISSDVFTLASDIFVQNLGSSDFAYVNTSEYPNNEITHWAYVEYTLP